MFCAAYFTAVLQCNLKANQSRMGAARLEMKLAYVVYDFVQRATNSIGCCCNALQLSFDAQDGKDAVAQSVTGMHW